MYISCIVYIYVYIYKCMYIHVYMCACAHIDSKATCRVRLYARV